MADMVFLTKLKPEPKGTYDASTAYGINSLVMSADGAAAYLSVKDVPAGTPLTNTEYWKIHTDLSLVKKNAEEAAEKALAARDEMIGIARNLTNPVEAEGNPVQAALVGGLPFDKLATVLEPVQTGSGDPAPDNIRPIGGWTGAKMMHAGKNLYKQGDQTITQRQFYSVNPPLPPGTYTVTGMVESSDTDGSISLFGFVPTDDSGNAYARFTRGTKQSYTVTTTKPTGYFVLYASDSTANSAGDTATWSGIQVEYGALATEVDAYQGGAFTADFGQTVYGGELNWQTGVLTVDRGCDIYDGSENWSIWVANCPIRTVQNAVFNIPAYESIPNRDEIFCSHAANASRKNIADNASMGIAITSTNQIAFYLGETTASVDSWKAYLAAQHAAGTPVQVAYKLANPIIIQLTPQEIAQLEGVNTLYGDGSIAIVGRQKPDLALVSRIEALESAILNA